MRSGESSEWEEITDARHSFANVVLAAGKRLGIEPFASMEVPRIGNFHTDSFRQMMSDIDHYTTQLMLDNSIRARSHSTVLPETSKDKIRSYLHHLREAINGGNFSDAKKADLLKRIEDFDGELKKSRLNIFAITLLAVEILAIPGALGSSYEIAAKLISNITQVIAEAKAVENEQRRLPPTPEPFAILPARNEIKRPNRELDDEIPF